MDEKFYRWLIPQKGLLVRDPTTMIPLPEEGDWKPWIGPEGRAWRRKVRQKTVTIGQPPTTTTNTPPTSEAAFRKVRKNKEDKG